jgi:outer membrane protein assembly factor BamB
MNTSPFETISRPTLARRPGMVLILGCLLGVPLMASHTQAIDWPQWRGPQSTGISAEKGWSTQWPKEGPRVVWKAGVGTGFSSVAVAAGRAYTLGFADGNDTVFCFDAETGKEIWKHSYPSALDDNYYEGGPSATPSVEGSKVYTLGKRGDLFCFGTETGNVIWKQNIVESIPTTKPEWGFAGSPLILGDNLIVNAGTSGAAFAKSTGKTVWSSGTNAGGYATPVAFGTGDSAAVAVFSGDGLVGVRASDGHPLWQHPWVEEYKINAADPIFPTQGSVFLTSYGRGCALLRWEGATVKEVWTNKNLAVGFNSCVFLDGYLYGVHGTADGTEKEVRCVSVKTGEMKWKQEKFGLGSVIAADGKLILLSERGELVVAEASPLRFQVLARAQVLGGKCWTTPTLANGRIYCRNAKGSVVCVDVRPSPSNLSPIPVNARSSLSKPE